MRPSPFIVALVLIGCDRPSAAKATASTAIVSPASASASERADDDVTTPPDVALANFRAGIAEFERHVQATPESLEWNARLLHARLDEAADLGVVSSLDAVVAIGARMVAAHPKDPKAHELAASARGAIHDFAGAARELDEAEKLGADRRALDDARSALALATGDFDRAHEGFSRGIAEHASASRLLLDAVCLGAMQRTAEADAQIDRAAAAYRDVSPFMVSWIDFERGELWDRAGDRERAKRYYRSAVLRLPQYARAALALGELSPAAEAKALLDALVADDPERAAALALIEDELAPGSDKARRDEARAAYDARMKKYPRAFAGHAAWFYLAVAPDPDKARAAAAIELDNRKTPDAYALAIAAELAADRAAEACRLADAAMKLKYPSPELRRRAAAAYRRCGKPVTFAVPEPAAGRGRP